MRISYFIFEGTQLIKKVPFVLKPAKVQASPGLQSTATTLSSSSSF